MGVVRGSGASVLMDPAADAVSGTRIISKHQNSSMDAGPPPVSWHSLHT